MSCPHCNLPIITCARPDCPPREARSSSAIPCACIHLDAHACAMARYGYCERPEEKCECACHDPDEESHD